MNDLPIPSWISGEPEYLPATMDVEVIDELLPFLEPKRYKVAYGGRGSSKSWGIARMLIAKAYMKYEKILCCREFQGSIEESVLALLESQIIRMGLTSAFEIQAKKITCLTTGSVFLFEGLKANVTKIKSMEGVSIVWAEEAEKILKKSWDILTPTIRTEGSEIWVSFNPDDDLDETYQRFVEDPPDNCYTVQVNYHKNPWFPEVLRVEMEQLRAKDPGEYEHVWEGKPKTAIKGAFYAQQMTDIVSEGRLLNLPYDPDMMVITSWDLGMADSTVIWFYQISVSEIRVINCLEFKGTGIPDIVAELNTLPYQYSQHIGPHDIKVHELGSGKSRLEIAANLGLRFTVAPSLPVDDGIMATKSILKRCYFDKEKCMYGVKALKRYRTEYNEERKVFSKKPVHDWTSDFADSFRYFAITRHETGADNWAQSIEYEDNNEHI